MGDLYDDTSLDFAGALATLRRWYWRFFLGMPALLLVFGPLIYAFEGKPKYSIARSILITIFIIGWLTCWFGSVLTGLKHAMLRCPKCGTRHKQWVWTLGWRCKGCGLSFDTPPAVDAEGPCKVDQFE